MQLICLAKAPKTSTPTTGSGADYSGTIAPGRCLADYSGVKPLPASAALQAVAWLGFGNGGVYALFFRHRSFG